MAVHKCCHVNRWYQVVVRAFDHGPWKHEMLQMVMLVTPFCFCACLPCVVLGVLCKQPSQNKCDPMRIPSYIN